MLQSNHLKYFRLSIVLFTVLVLFSGQNTLHAEVLVKTEKFEIDESYLSALSSFYEDAGVTTTREQYLQRAKQIKIFAQEAKNVGLNPENVQTEHWEHDSDLAVNQQLIEDMGLAEAFVQQKMADYPLDDRIIRSYYKANPDRFRSGPWSGADLIPLDDKLKSAVRQLLLEDSKRQIINNIYDELKDKYELY